MMAQPNPINPVVVDNSLLQKIRAIYPYVSIIYKSDVDKASRFDAEYFKPEYLEIERKLERIKKSDFLYNLVDNNYENYNLNDKNNSFNYIEISGVNLVTGEYIKENILNSQQPSRAKKICNKFDLLISTVRPSRNAVSLILEQNKNLVASTGFCKLRMKKINPYFLFILFKTDDYISLLDRKTTATQYPAINEQDILNLLIPILPQSFQLEIEKIVKKAHHKQAQSKQLYKEAEKILLQELGLWNYKPLEHLTFETTKKEVDKAGRFDAEYFQPKYKEIIQKIENYKGGFDVVKRIINWQKGVEAGSDAYVDSGKEFLRVSDFSIFGVENSSKKISTKLFDELKEKFQPRKDDILYTKDGSIGICNVLQKDIDGVLSSDFLRLTIKKQYQDFEKECLALIFNSIVCKMQVEQLSGGAIIAHLKPSDFEKIKIPLLPPEIQNHIALLVQESHNLRKESKELLESAKYKVEQEIEQLAK